MNPVIVVLFASLSVMVVITVDALRSIRIIFNAPVTDCLTCGARIDTEEGYSIHTSEFPDHRLVPSQKTPST